MASWQWASSAYGPKISPLLNADWLAPIDAGKSNTNAKQRLNALTPEQAFDHTSLRDRDMAACCLAGLWLFHGFLDEAHKLSQDIETASGSYWHGLMHRREGDFSNSKYWFRRVGDHPIFPILVDQVRQLGAGAEHAAAFSALALADHWDPFRYIDLCAEAATGSKRRRFCELVQQLEWRILFDYCYHEATGIAQ